jgi:hypothetical protein
MFISVLLTGSVLAGLLYTFLARQSVWCCGVRVLKQLSRGDCWAGSAAEDYAVDMQKERRGECFGTPYGDVVRFKQVMRGVSLSLPIHHTWLSFAILIRSDYA